SCLQRQSARRRKITADTDQTQFCQIMDRAVEHNDIAPPGQHETRITAIRSTEITAGARSPQLSGTFCFLEIPRSVPAATCAPFLSAHLAGRQRTNSAW